ncbi:MAG: hypothetical protein ACHQ6T_18975, partial [Myxococcota bacterium]
HDRGPGTWYVALRGRAAAEIQKDAALRDGIEAFIDGSPALRRQSPAAVYDAIARHVRETPRLRAQAEDPPERPFLLRHGRSIVRFAWAAARIAALALLALLLWNAPAATLLTLAVLGALVWLARAHLLALERSDPVPPVSWDPRALKAADGREDRSLQNHMCSVTDWKPGVFRAVLLRLSLRVVGLAHRFWFNQGDLGGIPTIHFARWINLPENRELVFFSNFDGSWERYLGDFIDQASNGLNAIWSNTVGYPRTHLLTSGGARDEERFKSFARNSMWQTRAWYAAYRRLSVQNLLDDAALRDGLARRPSGAALDAWLRLL